MTGPPVPDHDAVLATKLHLPAPPAGFVPRSRLTALLDDARDRRLVLVCAPAGFGKTALLADWARSVAGPVAWLSLDPADNDPARFWRHVIAALGRGRAGLAGRLGPLLEAAGAPADGLVEALINELAAQPGDLTTLVLDDYHLIEAGPVHRQIAFLVAQLPPGLRLILATRSDPPLALARLRVTGRLAELRADNLRFSAGEAGLLLAQASGSDLPAAAVTTLTERTEGWAAGLQLVGLSLRGRPDREAANFVASFGGSHRYVIAYLTEEVLDRQTAELRGFLLKTSILDRLCGEVCDAVTGRQGSQATLEQVERANLFLRPLDDVHGWWRYHQLFADLLRARLQAEQPDQVAVLHRAAARWHAGRGLAADAVRHALAAGDGEWAARVIEQEADGLLFRGEWATLRQWLGALPAGLAGTRPRLLLARSRMALHGGHLEAVGELLDAAERAAAGAGPDTEPFRPSAGRGASLLANIPATIALDRAYLAELNGDADGAAGLAAHALAGAEDGEWMLASHARGYLGLAEALRGQLAAAEDTLSQVVAEWAAAAEHGLAVRGCHHLGQVQRAQGRLSAAAQTYRQAIELATPDAGAQRPGAGVGYVGLAEIAYERGELDRALGYVTQGLPGCRQFPYLQPLSTGLATLARIRQAQGDTAAATQAMAEAADVTDASPGQAVPSLLNPVPVQQARLLLAQQDTAAAARWAADRALRPADEPDYAAEPEYLVLARVLLAQGAGAQALGLLNRMLDAAAAQDRTGSLIELRALTALALAGTGDTGAGVFMLASALTAACPERYVRVFADEGAPMAALLDRLLATQRADPGVRDVPLGCLARILQATDRTRGTARNAPIPGLVAQLTAREAEVLQLLAAGQPNQGIAAELVVTLDTVKKHVGSIMSKLGAGNRTEAVARARELGLLS